MFLVGWWDDKVVSAACGTAGESRVVSEVGGSVRVACVRAGWGMRGGNPISVSPLLVILPADELGQANRPLSFEFVRAPVAVGARAEERHSDIAHKISFIVLLGLAAASAGHRTYSGEIRA